MCTGQRATLAAVQSMFISEKVILVCQSDKTAGVDICSVNFSGVLFVMFASRCIASCNA